MNTNRITILFAAVGIVIAVVFLWPSHQPEQPNSTSKPRHRDVRTVGLSVEHEAPTLTKVQRSQQQEPKPWRADPAVISEYSLEAQKEFYKISDQGIFYESQGFLNYFELMRDALRGDRIALAGVFDSPITDGAASESFSVGMTTLIEQLGDRYFAYRLSEQPLEIQQRIIRAIWPGQFVAIAAGEVPTIGNQVCTATGQLAKNMNKEQNKAKIATTRKPSD